MDTLEEEMHSIVGDMRYVLDDFDSIEFGPTIADEVPVVLTDMPNYVKQLEAKARIYSELATAKQAA